MTLRPATLTDASSLAALSIEVWIGTYLKKGINAFFADFALNAFTPEKMRALIADPAHLILVSEHEDGIVGFIRLTFDVAERPVPLCSDTEIATFYVQPRHHGTGVGTQLLNAALDQCRAQGVSSVWLATNAENTPAISYYLAKGFEHIGETHFEIDSQAYLNNVYRYQIKDPV